MKKPQNEEYYGYHNTLQQVLEKLMHVAAAAAKRPR